MSSSAGKTAAASDPSSEDYDPASPFYDVTLDPSSRFYVGPVDDAARSGDDIRAEVTAQVEDDPLASALAEKQKDQEIQRRYLNAISGARQGLGDGLELRQTGERPTTVWDNASHEQMVEVLNTNADSVAIAETSEEWVRLGNDLTLHQRAVTDAIDDSMGNWTGEGGDAAREHLTEVAKWLGLTAQGAVLTGRQQQIHSQTLNESQKQLAANPPVRFSAQEANAQLMQITDPVQYAQAASQAIQTMQAQQAARAQAARIMTQFDDTVGTAIDMPLFAPPPKLATATARTAARLDSRAGGGAGAPGATARQPDLAVAGLAGTGASAEGLVGPGGTGGIGDPEGAGGVGAGVGAGGGALPGRVDPAAGGTVPPLSPTPGTTAGQPLPLTATGGGLPGGVNLDDTTHTSSTPAMSAPPPLKTPDLPTGGNIGGAGGPGGIGSGPGGVGVVPGLPGRTTPSSYPRPDSKGPGLGKTPTLGWSGGVNGDSISSRLGGLDGGGAGGPGGSAPTLGTGGSGGAGGLGAGGGAASGAGAGGASSGAAPGQASGAAKGGVPGAAAAAAAGAAGAAGARGMTAGMAGMPAGGAGRQQEEDKEHRVADYLEAEENLFAGEQAIAPPVIGDWKKNKDEDWK
ncbi:hypothetical protein [Prauserella flavalba]|uniref:PPE family protein n=1 Tax=Prauserella flavalba TaxID=1477506 RepID=A0A318LU01_9PSEU|nr:hypothetical protein [Prauserella flavalba]PXY35867.1 hypothetical protein BA062_10370 [Prauserella flavalba]